MTSLPPLPLSRGPQSQQSPYSNSYPANPSSSHSPIMATHDPVGLPRPEDGIVLASIGHLNWSSYDTFPDWAPDFPHTAETSFVLPLPSHELYLLSRGSYQRGKLRVKQHGQHVTVTIRAAYHDTRALARTTVCRLHKGGNRNGVGIYTPTAPHAPRDRLQCDVVLTLPGASPDAPLRIPALTLLTSNFCHEIADVWRALRIDLLELATSNAPVRVEGITVQTGTVTSSNGAIKGHFNACALRLGTSNAGIQATASLFSAGTPATLDMRTSNGPITSALALVTDGAGSFNVQAHSSNGPVEVRYEDVPGRLVSEVRTSNAPAGVVAPGFEGTFEVSTSNGGAVVRDVRARDPTGARRRRVVEQQMRRDGVSGRAYWGGARGEGRCVVHTSNAGASLDL